MTRGLSAATLVTLLLVPLGPAAPAPSAIESSLALSDGASWADASVALAEASCVRLTIAGDVRAVGRGQSALLDVEGIGRVAAYFAESGPPSVRVAVTAPGAHLERRVGYAGDSASGPFESTAEICRSGGQSFTGTYRAFAHHTDGIGDDATSVEATSGTLELSVNARGGDVRLWNARDLRRATTVEVIGPKAGCCVVAGESVMVGGEVSVTTPARVFGSFVTFETAEKWTLSGPGGLSAWKDVTSSGGNVDPSGFRGPAGAWSVIVERSVSAGTPSRIFLVLAVLE